MSRTKRRGSFASRTRNIYRHQTARAGEPLPYTLAELRAVVTEALAAGTCPYCGWALTETNFSVDHHNPISRDGDFSIANILVCHLRCNKIKGNLTSHEFLHLTAFLAHFPPEVGKDVLARLYAGGRVMRRG
jgi:5-methylcytosine-specific restriction endonuclease McrA